MSRHALRGLAACVVATLVTAVGAQAPAPDQRSEAAATTPALTVLGEDRFMVGRIVVDQRSRSFVVPGRVNVLDKPLESLATAPGGFKAYEAALELDTTGNAMNLACILIGLERDPALNPFHKGGKGSLSGPRVTLTLSWSQDGRQVEMSAADAVSGGVPASAVEWVYTGSPVSQARPYFAAQQTGSLVGFVHDPATLIEAVDGIGIGAYGTIRGNPVLPPAGTAIELKVAAQARR